MSLISLEFHDTFEADLEQLVAKKARGETISVQKVEYHATAEENLIEALKASLK